MSDSRLEEQYKNSEHVKGAVSVSVPSDFTDLSTIHRSLGCLYDEVSVELYFV